LCEDDFCIHNGDLAHPAVWTDDRMLPTVSP
jgi:hypothetical protein